ncbi:ABC transporter substrate-binding protein [Bacillales bacterium AN1005]
MKLHQQYLLLHQQFGHLSEHEVTLAELGELLDCTHRNTLTIVKKMIGLHWIHWMSQRGRGRRSTLTLLIPAEKIAAEYMMQAMNRRELQQAAEHIGAFSSSVTMQHHLNQWLLGYSGHHTEEGIHNERIDTLRLPIRQQIHALDPMYINLLAESFITSHVFDGLVQRNEAGEIRPCLAHTWDVSEDRMTWIFYLRKGVSFHDGQFLTAEDVVYTFERLQSTKRRNLYKDVSKHILSIEAWDSLTVCFRLTKPHEMFIDFLSTSRASIVSPRLHPMSDSSDSVVQEEPYPALKPVGTGPFKVSVWDEHLCRLDAHPAYFQGRAQLDRVEILQIPWSAPTNWNNHTAMESPFFHLVHNPLSSTGADWSQISAGVTVRKLITCNTQKIGPLSDPTIRAHVQACVASEGNLLFKEGTFATSSHNSEHVSTNREHANDSLDRITPINPKTLQIATIAQYREDAARLAKALERHGYTCTVRTGTMEQFKGDLRLESDLILFSLIRDRDVELRRYDLYITLSEHLDERSKETVQNMLTRVISSRHPTDRTLGLDQIEQFLQEHSLLMHLTEKPIETAYLPSVRGVSFNSQGWVNLRHIWFPTSLDEVTVKS